PHVAAEADQARAQILGRVVAAAEGEGGAEAAELLLPRVGEELLLQLRPALDPDLVDHEGVFPARATLNAWRRRQRYRRVSSFRSSHGCQGSARSTRSPSKPVLPISGDGRSNARRSCSRSISPCG